MNSQADQDRLERLYQDQTPIEPPAGLDRMIRARAEQAIEQEKRIKSLPWMGGLATAAVLVLAVAVVIQMPEPTPELPMAEPTATRPASPAAQQEAMLQAPAGAEQAEAELDRVEVTGSRARSAEAASAFSDRSAAEPAPPARQSMRRAEAEAAEDLAEEAGVALRSAPVLEAEALADELTNTNGSPWLEIEEAIADGDAELATALLERLREVFPDDDRLEEYQVRIREIESGE